MTSGNLTRFMAILLLCPETDSLLQEQMRGRPRNWIRSVSLPLIRVSLPHTQPASRERQRPEKQADLAGLEGSPGEPDGQSQGYLIRTRSGIRLAWEGRLCDLMFPCQHGELPVATDTRTEKVMLRRALPGATVRSEPSPAPAAEPATEPIAQWKDNVGDR